MVSRRTLLVVALVALAVAAAFVVTVSYTPPTRTYVVEPFNSVPEMSYNATTGEASISILSVSELWVLDYAYFVPDVANPNATAVVNATSINTNVTVAFTRIPIYVCAVAFTVPAVFAPSLPDAPQPIKLADSAPWAPKGIYFVRYTASDNVTYDLLILRGLYGTSYGVSAVFALQHVGNNVYIPGDVTNDTIEQEIERFVASLIVTKALTGYTTDRAELVEYSEIQTMFIQGSWSDTAITETGSTLACGLGYATPGVVYVNATVPVGGTSTLSFGVEYVATKYMMIVPLISVEIQSVDGSLLDGSLSISMQ